MQRIAAYRFANTIWIEKVVGSSVNAKSIIKAILFSIIPWMIGLLISITNSSSDRYIATPTFYVGSIGIFTTSIGLVFGASHQYEMYDRLLASLEIDRAKRLEHVRSALSRHSSFWQHMRAAAIIFAIGLSSSVCAIFYWEVIGGFSHDVGTYLPRFRALAAHGWYDPGTKVQIFLILSVFLIFISATLGTSASIMLRMPVFLWRASSERPKLPPAIIKLHFAPAATVYAVTSLLWLCGVGFMFYFFGMNRDWASYAFVIGVFILGIVNLSIPQIAYLRTIERSEERYWEIVSARFGATEDVEGGDSEHLALPVTGRPEDVSTSTLVQLIKYEEWVYPVHQTYAVIGSYAASIVGTAIGWNKIFVTLADKLGQ